MIGAREADIDKTKEIVRIVLDNDGLTPDEIVKLLDGRVTVGYARNVRFVTRAV